MIAEFTKILMTVRILTIILVRIMTIHTCTEYQSSTAERGGGVSEGRIRSAVLVVDGR